MLLAMKIFSVLSIGIKTLKHPLCLWCWGRKKLPCSVFLSTDKLYVGYRLSDLDERGRLKLETIRSPNFSCNWSRFSKPRHVKCRKNGLSTDGCFSFTVEMARFQNHANPVHDPIPFSFAKQQLPNFSHVEVRELKIGEDFNFEPPKKRNVSKNRDFRIRQAEFRNNIRDRCIFEITALS